MKYLALATDYDGTIAHDGVVDASTIAALQRARAAGYRMVLATGRRLNDLFTLMPEWTLFDIIVAENGPVLFFTATKITKLISEPAPPALVERLKREGVPLEVGHTVVATFEPHEHAVLQAIHDLGLEWHIIFNKGSVMALPINVNKAAGLQAALEELKIAPEQVVGFGDAENDMAFLAVCGLSVAVANALPTVKAAAKRVTIGARGAGVTEMINELLQNVP